MSNISVIVPTYRRPADLLRCLNGIDRQELAPHDVVVIYRDTDEDSIKVIREWQSVSGKYAKKSVQVTEPGVLVAMKEGTNAAGGEIVAYTDDDAVPRADWLKRMSAHYADPSVGGVGGRDVQEGVKEAAAGEKVGEVTWYGKLIGNHHIGTGAAREVDVLKGVNMSFRKSLIKFPEGLLGSGAQVHFEVHLCLRVRRFGRKLIYDPAILVDHYPAQRFDTDQRNRVVPEAVRHAAYNMHLGILNWGGAVRAPARIVYSVAVGDRSAPGVARLLIACLRRERDVLQSFVPGQQGQWKSLWFRLRQGPPPRMRP